jgi:large subunit ribosomal protein L29
MKNSEIKALSVEELKAKLAESSKSLRSMKFAHAVTPIENPNRIRTERKFKARLLTELHERSMGIVVEKIKANELTNFNAREFLRTENSKLPSPMNLDKIKALLGEYADA